MIGGSVEPSHGRERQHFLVWMPRDRPRYAVALDDPETVGKRAFRPTAHITRQLWLRHVVSVGDVFWFVGNHPRLGRYELTLDGRIEVGCIGKCEKALLYRAGDGSAWLPWNDATALLLDCRASSDGAPAIDFACRAPQKLQTTRAIDRASGAALDCFADEVLAKPSLFISYRWREATDIASALLPRLWAAGSAAWFDRWSGPRQLNNRQIKVDGDALASMLGRAIDQTSWALIIDSPGYRRSKWTVWEERMIRESNKPVVVMTADGLRAELAGRASLPMELRQAYTESTQKCGG